MAPISSSAIDIIGPENVLLLFADCRDGEELDLLAAALWKLGRPASAVILAETQEDDPAAALSRLDARLRALAALGVPDERLLFVGFSAGGVPREGEPLFEELIEALRLLSWRRDCNVLGVQEARPSDAAGLATMAAAKALASREALPILVGRTGRFVRIDPDGSHAVSPRSGPNRDRREERSR